MDIRKYKSVALSHDSCDKLDGIRKIIVPEVSVSRAKALDILINEKEHSIVKKKVFKAIEKLKEKYEKRETSMPTMSGEWLHKDKEISGRSKRWNSSMSNV